jgi:hypothetical protein
LSTLFAPLVSIAPTKRRRYFWAAFWSGPPTETPFRLPDASSGGARTEAEAHAQAEKAAQMPLIAVSPRWARAYQRVLLGQPPFPRTKASPAANEATAEAPAPAEGGQRAPRGVAPARSIWQRLGLPSGDGLTDESLKRAFRERALIDHPDRGGTDEAFRELHAAFLEAKKRLAKPKPRRHR